MSGPVHSNAWYRVAALRPRLRAHARLHRHLYRGEVWYLLQDPASGRSHRFSPAARLVIAAMDGRKSVADLWALALRHLGDDAPTQDDLIQLLGQLHAADLLQTDVTPDVAELFERGSRQARQKTLRSFINPMAIRIPLWDPDRFLNTLDRLARPLWSRWGLLLWLAVVLPALFLVPPNWDALSGNFSDRVLAFDNLLLLWLIFPAIKFLHEMGHATAVKAGGGEVHDMGLMLLVLIPVPYVEASASSVFKSKYRRAAVGAAGMLVELFIAALAMYVWLAVEPGLVRAIAFNIMLIAGVSTLLFNGNPLLRYDAYYILVDLIEMPNLGQRALAYWAYLFERYPLGVREAEPPGETPREKAWCLFYGFASTVYRIFITLAIALFIAGSFFFIGVLLALWAIFMMAILPLAKGIKHLAANPRVRRRRRRAWAVIGGGLGALVLFLTLIPMPYRTQAEGVVRLADEATVRAGGEGFLRRYLVDAGATVKRGDAVALLNDPQLDAALAQTQARVAELETRYATAFVEDLARASVLAEQLRAERAALLRVQQKASALVAYAAAPGVFMAERWRDQQGRYFHKGDTLGYVTLPSPPRVRVVIPQADIDKVRGATESVAVRLSPELGRVLEARIVRELPAGESSLPSQALATEGGGKIALDTRDPRQTKTLERLFQFELALVGAPPVERFGQRAHVRFEHPATPLASQWYASLRRLFLTHFNV